MDMIGRLLPTFKTNKPIKFLIYMNVTIVESSQLIYSLLEISKNFSH